MFKLTLQEKDSKIRICLEKGITLTELAKFLGQNEHSPYDAELYTSEDKTAPDTLVIGLRGK